MASAADPAAPLTADRLEPALGTRWLGRRYLWLPSCGSTNDVAAAHGRAGDPEGTVVLAEAQTGGRGRLGRSWRSPPGASLTFSILLRPRRPPAEVPPLTLLVGAAVARALEGLGARPRLKWPNDVQLAADDGDPAPKKVAGILTEMASEGERVGHVVVGVGLNVNDDAFPAELGGRATSLALALGRPLDRAAVLAALLGEIEAAYDRYRAEGPAAAVALWSPHGAQGGRVQVRVGGRDVTGVALGIDPDGALRVAGDDGQVHRVISGEVT
jgi:BirA family biotin operon repressor/biotin-[acetyl-CoA-carboxylase] ligase